MNEMQTSLMGLSRVAVKNIVLFFILCLISAIGFLTRKIEKQDKQLIDCDQQARADHLEHSKNIEKLMREQIFISEQIEYLEAQIKSKKK